MAIVRGGKVTETAEQLTSWLDETYGPDQKVGSVVIVVEVMSREDGRVTSVPIWFGDDDREWIQRALLQETLDTMEMREWEAADEAEDD